jgi:predicted nucleic acid-binding protein
VKCFFDTSVLVPVFVPGHEHHERSITAFAAANRSSGSSAAHCLAELYATLTGLPGRYRASPEQAMQCLETVEERLTVVVLEVQEYRAAIREAAAAGIIGGTTYDALVGACAVKARADVLYTWNIRDFRRLVPAVAAIVSTP